MANRVWESVNQDGSHHGWMIFCPACGNGHLFDDRWTFNGNLEKPTFRASMLCKSVDKDLKPTLCHSFVTDGKIEFLSDCLHAMAGKTVDLPDCKPNYS